MSGTCEFSYYDIVGSDRCDNMKKVGYLEIKLLSQKGEEDSTARKTI